jgi:methionine aminotransferase
MSKMAADHGAINLSQGFPDFPVAEELVQLISDSLRAGHNQYAPMAGLPALRQKIAEVVTASYQRPTDAETEVTVTAGGTEALFSTIAAFVDVGDEVIVFDPAYDCYDPAIRLNGGVPVHINLLPPHFQIDWQQVESKITGRTRAIIVNTPHNPTGAVLSPSDLAILTNLAQRHGLVVISDEVYERIIFDQKNHESVLKHEGLRNHAVAIYSFGKTFHATGWKIGYAVASPLLAKEIRKTHQFVTFSVNTPIQHALAVYLATPQHYLALGSFYQNKRDYFLKLLRGSSFEPLPCFGSYFQLLSYTAVSHLADTEMAAWLTQQHRVASIPVSVFYKDQTDRKLLRFCFAKKEETLEQACEILRKL